MGYRDEQARRRAEQDQADTSPVDLHVVKRAEEIGKHGRGWVLSLVERFGAAPKGSTENEAGEGELVEDGPVVASVEVKESLPPDDEYQRPADYRAHVLEDVESFIDYTLRYGDEADSLVFFNDDRLELVIDDEIERGDPELIVMPFETTPEFLAWDGILGGKVGHKALLTHVMTNIHTLDDPSLLIAMRKVSYKAGIQNNSDIQDHSKDIGVRFVVNGEDSLVEFPKELTVCVPILAEDVLDERSWMKAKVRLQVDLPDLPGDPVAFTLLCSEWPTLVRQRTAKVAAQVKKGCEGFAVIRGRARRLERRLGCEVRPRKDAE